MRKNLEHTKVTRERFDFDFVEKQVRKKTFGVLSTIDSKGRPHSTGILYGVAPKDEPFRIYCLAGKNYVKVKNILRDPRVSFVITFPHYYLRFVPANYVMFRGVAEIIPFSDEKGHRAFQTKRILKMNIESDYDESEMIFISIKPEPRVVCYGLGIGVMEIRKAHTEGAYSVTIPEDRLTA
jgi:nitroimidazol reductase NimA-like FMN-containing flavoprotein (pyridoxamine 5'-phosphate oxidase superfamily)